MDTLSFTISALHKVSALVSLGAWAFGMYYWWITNNSLRSGLSRIALLNPMAYLDASNFSARGLLARRRIVLSFGVMFVGALAAWGLRQLLETHVAA
jgi:hypothetical protein